MRHEIGTAIIRIRKAGLYGFADEHDNDAGVSYYDDDDDDDDDNADLYY